MVEEQVLPRTQAIGRAVEVEVIRDLPRFNSIAAEWDRLVETCAMDRLFVSHAWFRTWWEAFGGTKDLHVVTLRSQGRLVAAAPMMRTTVNVCGFDIRALHAIYNPHTPRFDFIVANHNEHLYQALWYELAADSSCDAIVLAQIRRDSYTIPRIECSARSDGWLTGHWTAPVSPFIRLGCAYETYFNGLRSGCRFNLTKRYARLRRRGTVDVEVITDQRRVEEGMQDGLMIEAAAWKGRRGTAMISDPAVAGFYTRFAKRQAQLGQLRLTFLRAGGKRIAFNYILESRNKLYAVKIGYDPEYHAYSPGNMLLNLILKDACARGIEEYDLLGGDDEWKFDWTKEKREHDWLFLFRKRLRLRGLHYLKFGLLPFIKRTARQLRAEA